MAENESRSCGSCTACCKTHGIVALNKAEGRWCAHCAIGKGCKIYAHRPTECRVFRCDWLNGSGGPDERPDLVKIVPTTEKLEFRGRILNWCTLAEVSEGALQRPYGRARTEALRRAGWIVEWFTVGVTKQTVILPPGQGLSKADVPFLLLQLKQAESPHDG